MSDDDALVRFYRRVAPDNRGRYLDDILAFDDNALEYTHDYIQWLFPITTIGVNPFAPPATSATIEAFRGDASLRASLRRSLDRMLSFYGLERVDDEIAPAEDFHDHRQWLSPGNHNHLRLTRILKSLRLLGNETDARALHGALMNVADNERSAGRRSISSDTLHFWESAVRD